MIVLCCILFPVLHNENILTIHSHYSQFHKLQINQVLLKMYKLREENVENEEHKDSCVYKLKLLERNCF